MKLNKNKKKPKNNSRRLQSVLSEAGVSSRRKAQEIILSGRVKVDGKTIREKGFRVNPLKSIVLLDDRPLKLKPEKLYYAFNKPKGVVCTLSDNHAKNKISDYFKDLGERIYPVGRLDKNTEGLIFLTNDGDFAYRLSHPKFNIDKEYLVKVKNAFAKSDLEKLKKGIVLDGKKTPCRIRFIDKYKDNFLYSIVIHEGRKRQIRRMFKAMKNEVMDLKRVKYGTIKLDLDPGKRRKLTGEEIKSLITIR